jgi:hypothetical protein
MSAEADLWAAVFRQALSDACAPLVETKRKEPGVSALDAIAAWHFLTDETGDWAASRRYWATMNGVDGELVRQEALRRGASRQTRVALKQQAAMIEAKADINKRDQMILEAYAEGVAIRIICDQFKIGEARLRQIAGKAGVKRPPLKKSGSAVEGRGASRAAGGGEVLSVSPFHEANHTGSDATWSP